MMSIGAATALISPELAFLQPSRPVGILSDDGGKGRTCAATVKRLHELNQAPSQDPGYFRALSHSTSTLVQ